MPIRPRTPVRSSPSALWRHWSLWVWFAVALVLSVGGVALWKSGRWLIKEDSFEKARWAVVLSGESRDCERSDAAIRLFQDGRLDTLILSGTRLFKNRYQCEFVLDYVAQQGVPRDRVFEFRQDAYSTQEEARLLIRQFHLMDLDTVLIITSTYHTARTRRIFRKLTGGYPVVLVAAAEYHVFDPNAWWSNRESRKIWFGEWVKTLFTWYELMGAPPETGKADFQGLTPDIWASKTGATLPPLPVDTAKAPPAAAEDGKPAKDSLGKDAAGEKAADNGGEKVGDKSLEKAAEEKSGSDKVSGTAAVDSAKARKDSVKAAESKAKAETKAAEAKAAEAKAAKDSSVAEAASAKSNEAAKFAAEATRSAVEGKTATKDTLAKKSLPRAPKKPAGPAPKTVKKEEKKPEKAEKAERPEKAEKTKKKG